VSAILDAGRSPAAAVACRGGSRGTSRPRDRGGGV